MISRKTAFEKPTISPYSEDNERLPEPAAVETITCGRISRQWHQMEAIKPS